MKIAVGSDHAGFGLKQRIVPQLVKMGHEITDMGCYDPKPVDFPDIAKAVSAPILSGEAQRGVMFCGTGVGAAIACNKIKGIRACVCHDVYSAHQCVEHDDVQVLCLGEQIVGDILTMELIRAFLQAKFFVDDEDCVRRVNKLNEMEK